MPVSPSQHHARCQLGILSMVASCQLLLPKFQPQNHPHEPTEDSFLVAYCTSARSLRQRMFIGMKTPLIVSGCLKPGQEFVFPPVNGTKGVKAVASIVGGSEDFQVLAISG